MKELIFNTGGRRFFNEDLDTLQNLTKSFESQYNDESPFVITGVTLTLISGNNYDISDGFIWLGNRVRKFGGASNVDLTADLFINASDSEDATEYADNITRVSSRNYDSILSGTQLGGDSSLRISRNTDARRYVKDVLGSKALLLSPFTTTQTVQNNITLQGTFTTNALKMGETVTSIKKTVTSSHSDLATSKAVDDRFKQDGNHKGFIQMWSGSIGSIPTGWVLCDGRAPVNGQSIPNLKGKFIVGYNPDDTDYNSIGKTGGAKSVTLTEAQLPSHKHGISMGSAGSHSHTGSIGSGGSHSHSGSTNIAGGHNHSVPMKRHGADGSNIVYSPNEGDGFSQQDPNTSTAGSHSHTLTINSAGSHSHSLTINSAGSHTHSLSMDNAGGGQAHENRPPYYTLAFIIKTV